MKLLCLVLALFPLNFAYAEIHGTLTGTTNYVWRFYSKSNGNPAIQANLDYQHSSGFYVGTTASSFSIGPSELEEDEVFPGSAQVEVSPYVGWSHKFADDWRVDLQYSRYFYDGKIYALDGDYNEFYLFLHYKDLLSLQTSYIDDFYGLGGDSYFYELTGRYPLTDFLEVSAGFGYAQTENALKGDYEYWNAGITGRYKFIALDLRYYDSREIYFLDSLGQNLSPDHPAPLKPTAVLTLSIGF
jgi:uncharacterized protein (TIGR02001 family)